jgi:predicted membrane protein
MNEGLAQALAIQSYMTAELTTIRGTLYFLCSFFLILFVTSFKRYETSRFNCLTGLAVNILLEVAMGSMIEHLIGTHIIRYLFILFELTLIWKSDNKEKEWEEALSHHLNTPRLKNIFRKAYIENESMIYHLHHVSSQEFQRGKPTP